MAVLRFLSAGESHGPKISAIIEGLPAGFTIDKSLVDNDLQRRQQGFGRGGRMKIENDHIAISAGIVEKKTTGAPVALEIANLDYENWRHKDIEPMVAPRPGHADFAGALKYHHDDLRISLERASARETAIRTAVGSVCKQILSHFGIRVLAYVTAIGELKACTDHFLLAEEFLSAYDNSLQNEFAFIELSRVDEIKAHINEVMKAKDTIGGVFESVALGLPVGLGSYVHYDRRLDASIAAAMISIPAMKAVELGQGINNARLRGTKVHDEFALEDKKIGRTSNRAGGLEGGMSNGMPLVVRTYMKPISTTLNPRQSINLAKDTPGLTVYERSDFCAVQRAAVVGEAMLSFVVLNALMEKIGGDSRDSMLKAYSHLHKGYTGELHMKEAPWRFNYDHNDQA